MFFDCPIREYIRVKCLNIGNVSKNSLRIVFFAIRVYHIGPYKLTGTGLRHVQVSYKPNKLLGEWKFTEKQAKHKP